MCVGAVESCEKSSNFRETLYLSHKDVETCPSISEVCPYDLWSNGLGWVSCASIEVKESRECVWGRWSPVKRVVISEKLFNKAIKT